MKLKKKHSYANRFGHPVTLLHRLVGPNLVHPWVGFVTYTHGVEAQEFWSDEGIGLNHSVNNLHRVRTDRPAKEGELSVFWDRGEITDAKFCGIMKTNEKGTLPYSQVGGDVWEHCAPIRQYIRAMKEQAKCPKT